MPHQPIIIDPAVAEHYLDGVAHFAVLLGTEQVRVGMRVSLPSGSLYRTATVQRVTPAGTVVLYTEARTLIYRRPEDLKAVAA